MRINKIGLSLTVLMIVLLGRAYCERPLWVDFVTFKADSGNTLLDVSIKLSTDSLGVKSDETGEYSAVSFAVTVKDSSGLALLSDRWERRFRKEPPLPGISADVYVLDSSSLELPSGQYILVVSVTDRLKEREHSVRKRLHLHSYDAPGLTMSDILLSSMMPVIAKDGQFVRSGQRMVPNPDGMFGARGRTVYVYQEIYNLVPSRVLQDSFEITYRFLDGAGQEVRLYAPTGGVAISGVGAKVSGLSIAGLSPGVYTLEGTVEDPASGLRTRSERQLEIVQSTRSGLEEFRLTEEQLRKSYDILTYIASSRERSLLSTLDVSGKERFVERFWASKDPEPDSPRNSYIEEMFRRFDYANEKFGGPGAGWRTDRGRVYIVYGAPEEMERHVSNQGTRDYEIWTYPLEGEARFVFVDERGYGQYRLVHSTARGELQYQDWLDLIQPIDSDR